MDRNSVLAFLLIAIIILLMPEYYKLVYPDTQYSDTTAVTADKPLIKQREGVAPAGELLLQETADEQDLSFDVETNLYKATISNKNGGSFTFFELNNHALNDSELVNLINDRNQQNLDAVSYTHLTLPTILLV